MIHEVPNITPLVTKFANEVVDRGFTVVMPSLFGTPGKPPSNAVALGAIVKVCVAKEFTALALNQTSPIIAWLRALAGISTRTSVAPVSARSGCVSRAGSPSG